MSYRVRGPVRPIHVPYYVQPIPATEPVAAPVPDQPPLTVHDCDRCGARLEIRVWDHEAVVRQHEFEHDQCCHDYVQRTPLGNGLLRLTRVRACVRCGQRRGR